VVAQGCFGPFADRTAGYLLKIKDKKPFRINGHKIRLSGRSVGFSLHFGGGGRVFGVLAGVGQFRGLREADREQYGILAPVGKDGRRACSTMFRSRWMIL
jgi:hypothetical protein